MNRRAAVELAMLATMLCISGGTGTASAPTDPAARAKGVKVSVEAVSETRAADLFPPGQVDLKWWMNNRLLIQLKFQGDSVRNVSQIGPAVVDEAADDLNESLVKKPPAANHPASGTESEMRTVEEGV